jgi:hypothetical protein
MDVEKLKDPVECVFIEMMEALSLLEDQDRKRILLSLWEFYGKPVTHQGADE